MYVRTYTNTYTHSPSYLSGSSPTYPRLAPIGCCLQYRKESISCSLVRLFYSLVSLVVGGYKGGEEWRSGIGNIRQYMEGED